LIELTDLLIYLYSLALIRFDIIFWFWENGVSDINGRFRFASALLISAILGPLGPPGPPVLLMLLTPPAFMENLEPCIKPHSYTF